MKAREVWYVILSNKSGQGIGECAPLLGLSIDQFEHIESQLEKIKVGESSRQDIVKILGNPSTRGTFDSQVWYYISRQTEQWAFMPAKVVDQRVIAIYFNPRGQVQHLEHYRTEDGRKVDFVERETPTSGHELGFWEQMFGNLGVGIPGSGEQP